MSVRLILQTLGWIPVVWLIVAHLLADRGRIARDSVALRLAGCAAAAVVVVAAIVANLWPVAALGLLWLRTEVFANRHPIHEFRIHREQARLDKEYPITDEGADELVHHGLAGLDLVDDGPARSRQISQGHAHPGQSDRLPKAGAARAGTARAGAARVGAQRRPTELPGYYPREPKKVSGHPVLDAIFKIEVIVVVIIVLVIFGIWAQHQRFGFNNKANASVCGFMINHC